MKQAFVITAYQDFLMLKLICEILHEDFFIYIHVDVMSKSITEEQIVELNEMKNVYVIQKYECYWNSLNHLLALIDLAKEALKNSEVNYIHFSTGQDLPIRSNQEIIKFFEESGNKSFLNFQGLNTITNETVKSCWKYYHFFYNDCDVRKAPFSNWINENIEWQKKNNICKKGIGEFTVPYKGIIWSSFTREALEYCFNYIETHPEYWEDIKYTRIREEFCFHTILFNTPSFQEKIVTDGKHGWHFAGNGQFYNISYEDFIQNKKKGKFFVRKIHSGQEELINTILETTCKYRLINKEIYYDDKVVYSFENNKNIYKISDDIDIDNKLEKIVLYKQKMGKNILLENVVNSVPINKLECIGNIKGKRLQIITCGKNLFDPFKICYNNNKDGFHVNEENQIYYKNESGVSQRVHFGKFNVIPNSIITLSVSTSKYSIALYELTEKGKIIKQNWLGPRKSLTIKLQESTALFMIVLTSKGFIEKVNSSVKIQVEYGSIDTEFEIFHSETFECLPDSYCYRLPEKILQEEKKSIYLNDKGDSYLNVEYSTKNSTIERIYAEIQDLREEIQKLTSK